MCRCTPSTPRQHPVSTVRRPCSIIAKLAWVRTALDIEMIEPNRRRSAKKSLTIVLWCIWCTFDCQCNGHCDPKCIRKRISTLFVPEAQQCLGTSWLPSLEEANKKERSNRACDIQKVESQGRARPATERGSNAGSPGRRVTAQHLARRRR